MKASFFFGYNKISFIIILLLYNDHKISRISYEMQINAYVDEDKKKNYCKSPKIQITS